MRKEVKWFHVSSPEWSLIQILRILEKLKCIYSWSILKCNSKRSNNGSFAQVIVWYILYFMSINYSCFKATFLSNLWLCFSEAIWLKFVTRKHPLTFFTILLDRSDLGKSPRLCRFLSAFFIAKQPYFRVVGIRKDGYKPDWFMGLSFGISPSSWIYQLLKFQLSLELFVKYSEGLPIAT